MHRSWGSVVSVAIVLLASACSRRCPPGLTRSESACIVPAGGADVELGRGAIGPEGGSVVAGGFRLDVPPGALSTPVTLVLSAASPPASAADVLPGSVVRIEPTGTLFAVPARLTIGYDASTTGVPVEDGDRIVLLDTDPPTDLAATRSAAASLSGELAHLSRYGIVRASVCLPPRTRCRPGICVQLASDPTNCGACDVRCAPGASCIAGACSMAPRDAGADASRDAGSDAGRDVGTATDAGVDGGTDGGADAGTAAACTIGAAGIATHVEVLSPAGTNPQVTGDAVGAEVLYGAGRVARLDSAGAVRATEVALPAGSTPAAIVRAGAITWALSSAAGVARLQRIEADGSLGAAWVVGTGQAIEGGLAYHAASDTLGVLRDSGGSLIASRVVASTGAVTDETVGPSVDFLVVPAIAARDASSSAAFTVVYASEVATYSYVVWARDVAPLGARVMLAPSGAASRTALHVAPTSTAGTLVAVWLESDGVHAATLDAATVPTTLGGIFAPPAGGSIARVTAQPGAIGFDLVLDRTDASSMREIAVVGCTLSGMPAIPAMRVAPVCAPGLSEGRVSFVAAGGVRRASWIDLGVGGRAIVATF